MHLELVGVPGRAHGGVGPRARERDLHGLVEDGEAVDLVEGAGGGVGGVEDDEGLAFALEGRFGDDFEDAAVRGEDCGERFEEVSGFYAFG